MFGDDYDYNTAWSWTRKHGPLKPTFEHDCDACILVATSDKEDIWFCPAVDGKKFFEVMARTSSEGPDYTTFPLVGLMYTDQLRKAPTWALLVAIALLSGRLTPKGEITVEEM